MSLLKVNEVQNYNGSSLTLTASTVSTSAQLNTGGNISVTGSLNVSDDSTTRNNLGLGTISTQDSNNVNLTGGTIGSSVLFPAGHVLQVVEGSTDTSVTVSTTTFTDTGLSASITPTSASNRILVIFSQEAASSRTATTGDLNIDIRLLRDATVLEEYADYAAGANATGLAALYSQVSATYLDSPSTTSSVTYKLQGKPDSTANSQTAIFQLGDRGRSSIVLMEIAA